MRRNRCVKIIATLGPASSTREMITALVKAGADVFRLNMSHGTHADHAARHALIRQVEADLGRPIAILADLQGPKLRIGTFANGPVMLTAGQKFTLDLRDEPGDARRVRLPHPEILKALKPGARLLINDGKIRLTVNSATAEAAETTVVVGGEISDRKGVNVPDVMVPLAALSEKDRADLDFACSLGVDWLALSFVQRADDVAEAKKLAMGRAAVMAKIEKPQAVENLDSILELADGIMVARGDLGVEFPVAAVPPVQKRLVHAARALGKPVVVATQMLESMISSPVPTRAEVSDVANAIYDGADAVMLSAESAAGLYPIEAVATMNAVAESVERDPAYRTMMDSTHTPAEPTTADAITAAAREVAETARVKVICCFTHSGTTALRAARERPRVPILTLTPIEATARRMTLVWGLHCVVTREVSEFKQAVAKAIKFSAAHGFARHGEKIIITAGVPFNVPGTTNILRVAYIGELSDPGDTIS